MTILEALTAAVQVPGIDTLTLEKVLIDANLTSSSTYIGSDARSVDMAAVDVLRSLIVASESEGGFSYSISQEALQRRITGLLTKWGVDDIGAAIPKINGVARW